jgi:hypothetical protein
VEAQGPARAELSEQVPLDEELQPFEVEALEGVERLRPP